MLTVTPVACVDRVGRSYEVTLELSRDRLPYGTVVELFSFRYRTRRHGVVGGELGCRLRTITVWEPRQGGRGAWRLTRPAFVEA